MLQPPPPAVCPGQPVEISVTIEHTPGAAQEWTYSGSSANPPDIVVSPNGDMNFAARRTPVLINFRLVDAVNNWVFFHNDEINVFGYAEDEQYANVRPIPRGHHQIRILDYADGHTLQVCYINHSNGGHPGGPNSYPRSRYTTYLGQQGNTTNPLFRIDPIISNGGNI